MCSPSVINTVVCVCVCRYRLWVRQWSEPVVVFLSCRIPETQVHWFTIHHHIGRIVVKAGRRGRENKGRETKDTLSSRMI